MKFVLLVGCVVLVGIPARAQNLCTPIQTYGGVGDGVTDNATPLSNALAALGSTGGCVAFSAGRYLFNSAVTYNLPVGASSVSIIGSGAQSTVLYWPASNGLVFNYRTSVNAVRVTDLTLSTGSAGGYAAITATQIFLLGAVPTTSFRDLQIRGDDGGGLTQYWSTGISIVGVSFVDFDRVTVFGSSSKAGDGVVLMGNTSVSPNYGIVYNFRGSNFMWTNVGIQYGSYIQGVTVNQCNFTNGQVGIQSIVGGAGSLTQLAIANSQFNTYGAAAIYTDRVVGQMMISNNLFFVQPNQNGLAFNHYCYFTFTGNILQGSGSTHNNNGLVVGTNDCSNQGATIVGISFSGFTTAIWLLSSSSGVNVQSNAYFPAAVPGNVFNQGSGNIVGGGSK
jgi:hypothetical protein